MLATGLTDCRVVFHSFFIRALTLFLLLTHQKRPPTQRQQKRRHATIIPGPPAIHSTVALAPPSLTFLIVSVCDQRERERTRKRERKREKEREKKREKVTDRETHTHSHRHVEMRTNGERVFKGLERGRHKCLFCICSIHWHQKEGGFDVAFISNQEISSNIGNTNQGRGDGEANECNHAVLVCLDALNHGQILLHAFDVLVCVVADVVAGAFVELDE